jgi:hypothetical protein
MGAKGVMATVATVHVTFHRLWIPDNNDDDPEFEPPRRTLSELTDPDDHIHGLLTIDIGGRRVPHLGFFGPDDVCIGEWAFQFRCALASLRESTESRFVYDEGEQGQPAFLFEREDQFLFVSVVASDLGRGAADPDCQRVSCPFGDFERSVEAFLGALRDRVSREALEVAEGWWRQHVERDA